MATVREIEMTATVGDYANGDGAKVFMDASGVSIQTDVDRQCGNIEWAVWDGLVAEAERFRRAQAEAARDVAVLPVERRG